MNITRTLYHDRPIQHVDNWTIESNENPRFLKVYSIVRSEDVTCDPSVVQTCQDIVTSIKLPSECRYGFATIHVGVEAIWLLVDVWADDILHHFLFAASLDSPTKFEPIRDSTMACVWELSVLNFERDAWVRHVMMPERPEYLAYLNCRYQDDH